VAPNSAYTNTWTEGHWGTGVACHLAGGVIYVIKLAIQPEEGAIPCHLKAHTIVANTHARRAPSHASAHPQLSFGRYIFNLTEFPVISKLFQDAKFQRMAQPICPADQQHLDPFQFNIIIQTPGQSVATHVDGVYFWGASCFQFHSGCWPS